ncbi:hypothetical protein PVAND_008377 [Polypedilum vanderplanki]|uniref:C2H2-type domain-containing protein n=1 Tax=Polypedilum vanderplanki TaxID=319348 RepID=A0A9J6C9F4_POLVA|nr:hypothetical protein PVAND_008377 [Polypedilum vanderplanki]
MAKTAKSTVKVKEENEIQSYINSFKEIEETDDQSATSGAEKIFISSDQSYEQLETVVATTSGGNGDEYKYVFIVQDDEEIDKIPGEEGEENIYEFEDIDEEELIDASDDKTKIVKVGTVAKKSGGSSNSAHTCKFCNYSTTKRYLLARHMKCHSEDRPHKCNVCERGFKTIASLTNHVNTHTGIKPHHCKHCDSCFTTSGELVRHVRYRHTHEKPHKCPECDYASVELSKLKRHIRCHTGERPYQCPHCTYASPDTFKLKRHLRIHTGEKPYQCDICQARFTQSNSLKAHKLIHSVGEKPVFQCELCPTTCGRKTDLRIHVQKLHTSDVPIKCKRCNSEFPDRYSYKIHAKTHEGEKCYKCELCSYASISARHLESHMLIHTDEKPYQCPHCEQTFRQKQLLKRHENIYHNPNYVAATPKEKTHSCPTCGKAFRHKGNLMRHMVQHEGGESSNGSKIIHVKEDRDQKMEIENDENYVVVEVIDETTGIQYEQDELDELEAEEIQEEVEEDYTLTENIDDADVILQSPKQHSETTNPLSFNFSDDDEQDGNP